MKRIWCLLIFATVAPAADAPRINGPKVYGVHPARPFLYTIPATGPRPMKFSARGLPRSLKLDSNTGRITGTSPERGEYTVTLRARNSHGTAERAFRIVSGDTLALTPPMGWSTWYMAYAQISDQLVRAQADAMVSSGLIQHGYSYINIDDGWNVKPGSPDPEVGGAARDGEGNLLPNKKFPDMKALCDYVHSKGLKIGIYIGPGPLTCAGYEASYGHEEQDARQFARWGFDFLKYDLCSYRKLIKDRNSVEENEKPYLAMHAALEKLDRDFVYNLCQYGLANVWEWGRRAGGNFWRTTGDVGSAKAGLWERVSEVGFSQAGKEKWAGPGGWNDPDNLLIGQILWHRKLQPTPLTADEQYSYVTLWSILAAPLVFGGDMTKLDDFTLDLLTNDEVIDINQDVLGRQGAPVWKSGDTEVWAKDLADGSKAAALFNRGESEADVAARWRDLSIRGKQAVRDVWSHTDLGEYDGEFRARLPKHGSRMLRLRGLNR
ncbi:MAG TPA: putative Ig domain-containing protein [Bryobacteraceae bacterium]|nr:putative Ig domain-containing protein [Bryobacteraceae bacterium]